MFVFMIKFGCLGVYKMQLKWKQKDFNADLDFILFHQRDDTPSWWRKQLFNAYPELNYEQTWSLPQEQRFKYIAEQMKIQAKKRKEIINNSIKTFQRNWDAQIADKLNAAYASAFDNDCTDVLNDMVANVGLNPICPRDIKSHGFDIYHYFDTQYAIQAALHEITHFVWFYFWQKQFLDDPSEYDFPQIKWLLSELVVETINRNSKINELAEAPQYIAYSYFYDMDIGGEYVFDTLKHLYLERCDIYDFMEKAFDWIKSNEPELRKKIAEAEK